MSMTFFKEIGQVFRSINQKPNARVAILQAEGKVFSAGLDLKEASSGLLNIDNEGRSFLIQMWQEVQSK